MRALWRAIGREQHKTLKKCFSAEGGLATPQRHLAMLEPFLVIIAGVVLPTSHKQRPGMLLNSLPCTGQASQQRIIWAQMATVLRLRKPTLETDTSPPSQKNLETVALVLPHWLIISLQAYQGGRGGAKTVLESHW